MTRCTIREKPQKSEIKAFFTNMPRLNDITYSKYLHTVYEIKEMNTIEGRINNMGINLSVPEATSLSHVLRLSPHIKEKWGHAIRSELTGLYDSETFF